MARHPRGAGWPCVSGGGVWILFPSGATARRGHGHPRGCDSRRETGKTYTVRRRFSSGTLRWRGNLTAHHGVLESFFRQLRKKNSPDKISARPIDDRTGRASHIVIVSAVAPITKITGTH